MAPSILLEPDSPPSYSLPTKQAQKAQGGVSLEAHAPTGVDYSFHSSSANGNSYGSSNNATSHGNPAFPGRQLDGREFITSQTLLQQSNAYASAGQSSSGTSKKPNILYIMADQMAAPLQKFNDPNSVIKTPHLDELARTGVNFSSAYCNSPLCAPSRFTMCTGQLPSKIGGYDNASILGPEVPTYAHYLRREGYETALAGKMHFIGPDQLHGFEHR